MAASSLDICRGRSIVIGLSGGIACYKMASVVSALAQASADVTVVMTEAAARFVTPLTFQALTGRPVYTDQWSHIEAHDPQHIALARRADLMLVGPCTMDMLARLATGRTDDVVGLIVAGIDRARQPVLLAPSMNEVMWNQPATQRNIARLREDGFGVLAPGAGWQACRTVGIGRLPEPQQLLDCIADALRGRPDIAEPARDQHQRAD